MYRYTLIFLTLLITISLIQPDLFAFDTGTEKNKKSGQGEKVLIDPEQSLININNITSWVRQDGYHEWLVGGSWNGSFPINYYIGTIFTEGIVWGGKVLDGTAPDIRVNGNTYGTGCTSQIRIFRVRTDYQTADLTMDAATFFNISPGDVTPNEINQIYMQYQTDWNEWPASEGAPYKDVNEDGIYEFYIDIPGVPSASQTIFIKYDDSSTPLYGSPAIGLDITETYWAFADIPALNNVIFKKVDVYYKGTPTTPGNASIDSMYICQWSDPDIGVSTNDFAGCDTTLNLGYSYNGVPVDAIYQSIGYEPPASGYVMLQGASGYTGNYSDSAIFNFKWRHGYRYYNPKPMSSFTYFAVGGTWHDPFFTYTGTLEFYNLMRGFQPDPPYPASVPFPASVADYTASGCYLLTGDPVSGTGKLDGIVDTAGDRRLVLVSGPFNINLNDTIEIVIALTAASGSDYLGSVAELRKNAFSADSAFQTYVDSTYVVAADTRIDKKLNYSLSQNFPNPFNPSTIIRYSVPSAEKVVIKVYDMLGNEIAVLLNEEKPAGIYELTWNAGNLPSGVYFYQLRATPGVGQAVDPSSGSEQAFVQTKKMILLK